MRTLRRLTWLLIAIVATYGLTTSAFAQEARQFEAEVMAHQTDVFVLDSNGRPVGALTLDDFELYEDGVRQDIDSVELIEAGGGAAAMNATPRRFVFVVNRVNARFSALAAAKQALEVFVSEEMAEGDEAMVVELAYSTRVLQQFSASKAETLETIRGIVPLRIDYFSTFAARQLYFSLEELGRSLESIPGRKAVILMSYEPNRGRERFSGLFYVDDTVDALNQANATVYSINLDVLHRFFVGGGRDLGGLSPIATETGGRYFFFQSQISFVPIVREIARQNRSYYLLTYTPSNADHDGKYRNLEVRVKRTGLEVKTRPGYFAPVADEVVAADN